MKVIFIGYMGSGKSIIATQLASKLNVKCLELDDLIEKKSEMDIKTIFSEKGELYFRKLEHELFLEIMQSNDDFVLSTGGGTPCYYNNHELLKSTDCVAIYLKASIATLYDRLLQERKHRPMLTTLSDEELKEFIAKHLFERSFYYNQASHTIVVDGKSVDEIIAEILPLLT